MNEISIRRLTYFVAVAQSLHFGRAAEALRISQPALSSEIKKLEAELGLTVFTRRPRTALTREGAILYRRARNLLEAADRFRAGAADLALGTSGNVTIGCVQTFFIRGLPQAVTAIERTWPDISVHIREMSTAEQLELLEAGGIDIACCHSPATDPALTSVKVASELFRLCTPPESRASALADIAEAPFIIFRREASPHYWEKVMSICRAADIEPRVRHQTTTWNAVLSLIRQGLGVSLVPALIAESGTGFNSCAVDNVGIRSDSWLVMRREDSTSAVGQVFESLCRQLGGASLGSGGAEPPRW